MANSSALANSSIQIENNLKVYWKFTFNSLRTISPSPAAEIRNSLRLQLINDIFIIQYLKNSGNNFTKSHTSFHIRIWVIWCRDLKEGVMELSVFTLNCWGIAVVSKDRKQRMLAIADHLNGAGYDFVFLQEVWVEDDYRLLTETCTKSWSIQEALHTARLIYQYDNHYVGGSLEKVKSCET